MVYRRVLIVCLGLAVTFAAPSFAQTGSSGGSSSSSGASGASGSAAPAAPGAVQSPAGTSRTLPATGQAPPSSTTAGGSPAQPVQQNANGVIGGGRGAAGGGEGAAMTNERIDRLERGSRRAVDTICTDCLK